jgi:hypothetical protein
MSWWIMPASGGKSSFAEQNRRQVNTDRSRDNTRALHLHPGARMNKDHFGASTLECGAMRPQTGLHRNTQNGTTTMKIFGSLKSTSILTLGLLAATHLSAQVFPVTAKLTLQQQDVSTFDGTVYNDKVQTLKLSSTDLLNWLANAYQTNFPTGFPFGSVLVLVDYEHFQVQASDGTVLVPDTSDYMSYSDTYAETNFLFQGKENIATGSLNYTYFYRSTIQFNDLLPNGTAFTFSGNTLEKFTRSAQDTGGHRQYSGSLAIEGNGSGTNFTGFFLLSGKISTPTVKGTD